MAEPFYADPDIESTRLPFLRACSKTWHGNGLYQHNGTLVTFETLWLVTAPAVLSEMLATVDRLHAERDRLAAALAEGAGL